jgi:hypothetical protein
LDFSWVSDSKVRQGAAVVNAMGALIHLLTTGHEEP